METLPDELTFMLFDRLDTSDLIRNCMLVCKKWRNLLIYKYKLKELIILGDRIWQNAHSWYFTCKPISIKKTIYCWELNNFKNSSYHNLFFDSPSFIRCFNGLKYLKTYLNEYGFNLEQFNKLPQLNHLEVDNQIYFKIKNVKLTLLNLKILKIIIHKGKLIVDSDKLEILCVNDLRTLELVKPETVKYLELRFYDNTNLAELTNLKVYKNRFINHFDKNVLNKASSSLKEMHLYSNLWVYNFNSNKNIISSIMKQKEDLQRDVDVYFQGVKLGIKKFDDYDDDFNYQSDLYILHKNQDHLEDNLSWIYSIDYNELSDLFDQNLSDAFLTFFRKLNNVQSVFLMGNFNMDQFNLFLTYCPSLFQLSLQDPSTINQRFYDELFDKCPNLMIFEIKKENEVNEAVRLDYNFILDFKLMEKFNTPHEIEMDLAVKILKNLKIIKDLKFENHRNLVSIKRIDDNDRFQMKYGCSRLLTNLQIEQLISKCESIGRKNVKLIRSSYEIRKKIKSF